MRAELKGLHCLDIPDLEGWRPEDPTHFGFTLRAMVGPVAQAGGESFDIQVCTPSWFGQQVCKTGLVAGEHTLFMPAWDYRALVSYIERYVRRCEGDAWMDIAQQVARLGRWEFEGYRPFGA